MTSTTALESKSSGAANQTDDKLHRGRNVVLAFLMQGEQLHPLMTTDEADIQVGDNCSTKSS